MTFSVLEFNALNLILVSKLIKDGDVGYIDTKGTNVQLEIVQYRFYVSTLWWSQFIAAKTGKRSDNGERLLGWCRNTGSGVPGQKTTTELHELGNCIVPHFLPKRRWSHQRYQEKVYLTSKTTYVLGCSVVNLFTRLWPNLIIFSRLSPQITKHHVCFGSFQRLFLTYRRLKTSSYYLISSCCII
jgi:hypothetical protein